MMGFGWLLMMIVGGLVGWLTNRLAIRLLFKPYTPVTTPIPGFKLQGLIPRRKAELARSVGVQIETELLSMEDILQAFARPEQKEELKLFLRLYLNEMMLERVPFFLKDVMKKPVDHFVSDLMNRESDRLLNELLEYMMEEGTAGIKLAAMVEEKINAFPMERLEAMVMAVASRELKQIEWIGGFLGMLIGLMQGILLTLMGR
ncbi:DUF445 domain-containing protein [Anoxynatronum buryatiense]|uniref:DUF445 domain-containing protein n=1 Tax=Anoxynatronum buryatiense TaxID=489973 RepID=A0AA45WTE7_9CLOT|nr:DUF445 family protein [Anoxynatronum buryatiense]SMP41100.1 Protein of unknown function [Anoxynatronum buryatiense]